MTTAHRVATVRALVVLGLAAAGLAHAAAQTDADEEIDRFMERVLERREENSITRTEYVLDEVESLAMTGPGRTPYWGFRHEYTWYMRDGYHIRSPVRFDGVPIDEDRRRTYESDWLRQEEARGRRRHRERTPPTRRSRRSTRDNVRLAIERLWGADVDGPLLRSIAEDARAFGDDHAAITAAADRILDARGGVASVGFGRTVERARDGFVMLETGRLERDEVAAMLVVVMAELAADARSATDPEFDQFLELLHLAVRFELQLAAAAPALAEASVALRAEGNRADALGAAMTALGAAAEASRADLADPLRPDVSALSSLQPRFVSESYFLDFEFEPGNYYLAGRETLAGREVLRIEYYPQQLFSERDEGDPDVEDIERRVETGFEKTSLVTMWIDPAEHQIVRFTFDNVGFDFLPGRWLFRLDDLTASMTMGQPIAGVWLPARVELHGQVTLAPGTFEISYTRTFSNYRETDVGGRIRSIGPSLRE